MLHLDFLSGLNGASRQIGLSALFALIAFVALAALYRRTTLWRCAALASTLVMMTAMTVLAYTVRNPCRGPEGYHIGCGVENGVRSYGIAFAVAAMALGLMLAIRSMPLGWFLMAHGVYYYHYMLQFSHTTPMPTQYIIIAVAGLLLLAGLCHSWRSVRSR